MNRIATKQHTLANLLILSGKLSMSLLTENIPILAAESMIKIYIISSLVLT